MSASVFLFLAYFHSGFIYFVKRWTKMLEKKDDIRRRQIVQVLAKPVARKLEQQQIDFQKLQEIRLRTGRPMVIVCDGEERLIEKEENGNDLVTKEELRETLDYISSYSLYAYEHEMRQGFITIEGGHRVGMAGQTIVESEKIKNLKYISSVNIRISHEIRDCAGRIMPYISQHKRMCHTLIISPPGCGKTTLLRDIIRLVSDGNRWIKGSTVGVVDERSEIGACYMGVPQNDLGIRTDILDGCPKSEGMIMMIRSMSPQVLAVDEIGMEEDAHAIEYAMLCGCKMLATVHGVSFEEIRRKPVIERLIREKRFERYVVLSNRKRTGFVEGVYDAEGRALYGD